MVTKNVLIIYILKIDITLLTAVCKGITTVFYYIYHHGHLIRKAIKHHAWLGIHQRVILKAIDQWRLCQSLLIQTHTKRNKEL